MSRRWTNFIRGPDLHDLPEQSTQRSSYNSLPIRELSEEDSARIQRDYEEIINQPSTSKRNPHHLRSRSKSISEAAQLKVPEPLPAFSQLQKLAEGNKLAELKSVLSVHSVDLNRTDEYGWTLLMVAACAGSTDIVTLLLKSGADRGVKNKKGLTAYALAEKNNFKQVCDIIINWKGKIKLESCVSEEEQGQKVISSAGYCESCRVEYSCFRKHSRSIAHLISTSDNTTTRTHYGIPETNKGFQLLLKNGWNRERGLGPEGEGQKFPVKTILKRDRIGLGSEEGEKAKARVTHFGPGDRAAVKREVKTGERLERKRTVEKKAEVKRKSKEIRKEINFRRDLASL
ncbi:unnamed protein product [Allacma fusca]|uniref:G-patch domain-containing protein n=1 Tax=Allacma fusca TaxID=39272 RepID=A0A8J2PKS3_9HEXA|nr:unnamed protein product [Allacma fusca]